MKNIDKSEYKTLGDAVGMPDAEDKRNIEKIIRAYEKKHPGEIIFHRNMARDRLVNAFNPNAVVDKKSNRRYVFELPPDLFNKLEAYIPTLFRDKKHFDWFKKNFKGLKIPQ